MQTHEILPTGMYYTLKRQEMQASVTKNRNPPSKGKGLYARSSQTVCILQPISQF